MSGYSGDQPCPACGGTLYTYGDSKPVETVSGECLDCGFSYQTGFGRLSLGAVNGQRADRDLEPLKELAHIKDEFTKHFGKLPKLS